VTGMSSDVVDLFDRVADVYDEVLPLFATFGREVVRRLPPPSPGARLLDIGAGRGAIALPARARGYRVTATDASGGMIAALARAHPDFDVRRLVGRSGGARPARAAPVRLALPRDGLAGSPRK